MTHIEDDDDIADEFPWLGVAVRLPDGNYATEPPTIDPRFYQVLQMLNSKVVFTMSSEITAALLDQISPFQTEIQVNSRGIKIPIISSLADLAAGSSRVSKKSYMCVVRTERVVLVWNDSVEGILTHGTDVESILVAMVR